MEDRVVQKITLIATSCKESIRLFKKLIEKLGGAASRSPELDLSNWKDEFGRLKVWAGNIGAHLSGQASLDFRLRDAVHIRQNILDLLHDLGQTIRDTLDVLEDPESPGYNMAPGLPTDRDNPETELQQLHREVVTIIGCLFQTSMLVRSPAHHSLLIEPQPTDISAFEPWDRDHVRNSFPEASKALVERLGIALTQRRKRLKHRERHRMKLGRDLDDEGGDDLTSNNLSRLSDTIATDFKTQGTDLENLSTMSEDSQTTSVSSFMSGSTSATIPDRPRESENGAPFECPYCFYVITIESTRSWIKHVFNDLQPYICPFLDCPLPYKLYSLQREWINHLHSVHGAILSGSNIAAGNDNREQLSRSRCPLCVSSFDSSRTLERHLARHLQELALFVLPRGAEDSNDEMSLAEGDLASSDSEEQMNVEQGLMNVEEQMKIEQKQMNAKQKQMDAEQKQMDVKFKQMNVEQGLMKVKEQMAIRLKLNDLKHIADHQIRTAKGQKMNVEQMQQIIELQQIIDQQVKFAREQNTNISQEQMNELQQIMIKLEQLMNAELEQPGIRHSWKEIKVSTKFLSYGTIRRWLTSKFGDEYIIKAYSDHCRIFAPRVLTADDIEELQASAEKLESETYRDSGSEQRDT